MDIMTYPCPNLSCSVVVKWAWDICIAWLQIYEGFFITEECPLNILRQYDCKITINREMYFKMFADLCLVCLDLSALTSEINRMGNDAMTSRHQVFPNWLVKSVKIFFFLTLLWCSAINLEDHASLARGSEPGLMPDISSWATNVAIHPFCMHRDSWW